MVELVLLALGIAALATKNNVAGAAAASPGSATTEPEPRDPQAEADARDAINELRAARDLHVGLGLPRPPHFPPSQVAGAASGQVTGAVNVGVKKAGEAVGATIGVPGADKVAQVVIGVAAEVIVDAIWQKNAAGLTEAELAWVKGTGGQWEAATGQRTTGSGELAQAQMDVLERLAVVEHNDGSKAGALIFGEEAGDLRVGGFTDGSSLAEVAVVAGAFDPRPPLDRLNRDLANVNFGE